MTLRKRLVVQGLVGVIAAQAVAYAADAPASKWYDTVGVSGYLQTSYVGNLANSSHNLPNVGRQFDGTTNANTFSLNRFLLQIAKPVSDSDHYGFTARLAAGQDAGALPSGTNSFAVQEAYLTYAVPSTKLQIIGGRFVTPEGFEGVDTVNNPNFSEGLLFTAMEPISHTGLKVNYAFSDKVNATIGLVNGWNVDQDNNGQKTILWQIATTPTKQISWSFQGLYGNEVTQPSGVIGGDHADTLSLDTVLGFAPTDKLSLNAQLNYRQTSNDPTVVLADAGTTVGKTHATGAGLWASLATSSIFTEVVRYEIISDENGSHVFPGGPFTHELTPGTATNQTVQEFTLTHKTMLASNMGTRLEYRHDWSNEASFVRSDGSAVRNQNTISADWFVTF